MGEPIMNKAAFVRARIEPHLKGVAEGVLHELGITPTQAITMLYKRIAREHEWPLELKLPNEETLKIMQETDKGMGLKKAKSLEEFFKELGI